MSLAQHQFGHGTGVGVRRVEDRNTLLHRGLEFDLIGADAEAADGDQLVGGGQHLFGDLGAGADADEMGVFDLFDQGVFIQRSFQVLDIGVAVGLEHVQCVLVHAFQQQETDLGLVERELAHGHPHRVADRPTELGRKNKPRMLP
jgi:hypothetical protein